MPSTVYPAVQGVDPDLFGIAVVGTSGLTFTAGDATTEFTIMSVAKPFVFALVCDELGLDEVRDLVGVNATGLPFNAVPAVERRLSGRTNPMVNPGAIATTSLVPGASRRGARGRGSWTGCRRSPAVPLDVDDAL